MMLRNRGQRRGFISLKGNVGLIFIVVDGAFIFYNAETMEEVIDMTKKQVAFGTALWGLSKIIGKKGAGIFGGFAFPNDLGKGAFDIANEVVSKVVEEHKIEDQNSINKIRDVVYKGYGLPSSPEAAEAFKKETFEEAINQAISKNTNCLLYTSPSPRDATLSRMPSSA